jgi:four helix bundle protein
MPERDLKKRTKDFAHRCVKLALSLPNNCLAKHIQIQLIRCGTSTAANYRAACIAQSRAAFVSKISIAIEEADESCYWMEFIVDEKIFKKALLCNLINETMELTAILIASRKTAKKKKNSE